MYQKLRELVIGAIILSLAHCQNVIGQNNISLTNQNVFIGSQTGSQNTGSNSVFVGYQSGKSNTSAGSNTFIGYQSGYNNTTGIANFIGGALAGFNNNTGSFNVFLGPQAGANNSSGNYNMFMGNVAGALNKIGSYNMAIGAGAGYNNNASQNTYIGTNAGFNNATGANNVFIGQETGQGITGGNNNVFIGFQANSGGGSAATLSNAIAIGAYATVTASNALVLGNGVNVGIGNTAPGNKLELTQGTDGNSGLRFTNLKSSSTPYGSTNQFLTVTSSGDVVLATVGSSKGFRTSAGADSVGFWNTNGQHVQNTNVGGVIIGPGIDKTPAGYRLFVAEGILTEKVKVAIKNTNEWSDKVFAKSYRLRSLREVEQFINQQQHLPGIPSAEEVVKEGVNVGQMQAKLLEKIEELTLYTIQQQKEIEQLKQLIQRVSDRK